MPQLDEIQELSAFGATPDSVVPIADSVSHAQLDYLDLPALPPALPRITAVIEMAGRPVLYVARGPLDPAVLEATCHLLAQRGAADHLGLLEPGRLTVMPLLRPARAAGKLVEVWNAASPSARGRLPGLAFGTTASQAPATGRRLHDELVSLLATATSSIVDAGVNEPADALSLVGRALFLRFLMDRKVVDDRLTDQICPGAPTLVESMDRPSRVRATSRWLDETFNGNFLPLSVGPNAFWQTVADAQSVCSALTRILLKTDQVGQMRFDWETLDFSHIPVGLLSQVYERWCHRFSREKAIQDSVWYTPRSIAEYVVREAFYGLPRAHAARVLDPAVGAGVFLVAAFREIVASRWEHDGVRPDRRVLREILYRQLVGFDINEASLRLSALALYLTALELDPDPRPPGSLRFRDLRKVGVLLDVRGPLDHDDDLPKVGSLGRHVGGEHRAAFDVVVGNPPWTAWTSRLKTSDPRLVDRRREVESVVRAIAAERGDDPEDPAERFEMADLAPDLPFYWRALDWARPGGVVALALHARILFRQSASGVRARNQLFATARVSGILNGAALAQTEVWPSHEAPFCLLFTTNEPPSDNDSFHFVSPVRDSSLNRRGYLRIDAAAARPIIQSRIERDPWLLKTHYLGTNLDVEVVSNILSVTDATIAEYWSRYSLSHSRGYVEGGKRSRKSPAPHLHDLPDVSGRDGASPRVVASQLPQFVPRAVHQGRRPGVFAAPLVLVFEAPRHDRGSARALMSEHPVAFNHRYYGFSAAGHAHANDLAGYLLVLLNSSIALYLALMRSAMFGADRKRLLQSDLGDLPFLPIEDIPSPLRRRLKDVAADVLRQETLPQGEIDAVVGELFKISRWDAEVIRDTLDTALPFKHARDRAQARPSPAEQATFRDRLRELVAPVLQHVGRGVEVEILPANPGDPWLMLAVRTSHYGRPLRSALSRSLIDAVLTVARDGGASQVVMQGEEPGLLLVAIFAQYRYWTPTQARLLALDLVGPQYDEWLRGLPS